MAYLVTNPRNNSLKDRVVAKHLKISLDKAKALKSKDYAAYNEAFNAAGGKATAEARRARGKAFGKSLKSGQGKGLDRSASWKAAFLEAKERGVAPATPKRTRKKKGEQVANPKHNRKHNRSIAGRMNGAYTDAVGFIKDELNFQNFAVAGVVGGAHFYLAPMVSEQVAKLPYVGEWASENASYSITGLGAGALLVAGGAATGNARYGAIAGALAFGSGVVLDVVGYLTRRAGGYGDIAVVPNPYGEIAVAKNPYGDLAVTAYPQQEGQVGLAGYGGLGLVEVANPNLGSEYADADLNDAHLAPADFDSVEGQALIDGPVAVATRFPVNRASGYRKQEGPYSRHAGKQMHRWGWLIKCVGAEKARAIAALPPQERLKVIAAIKRQALAAANRAIAMKSAPVDFSGFGAIGPSGAFGAQGASGGYGSEIALGVGF